MAVDTNAMLLVRWAGPYSFEEARTLGDPGLYLCWGQMRLGRNAAEPRLMYCGISSASGGVGSRIAQHEGKSWAHPENEWWIGRVVFPTDGLREWLEAAEWMIAYFVQPEHNDKLTRSAPRPHLYLVNEWTHTDGRRRKKLSGVCGYIADVIGWNPDDRHLSVAEKLRVVQD
jgi:hypothetical protein